MSSLLLVQLDARDYTRGELLRLLSRRVYTREGWTPIEGQILIDEHDMITRHEYELNIIQK